jgi:hypothetical protein
MTVPTPDQLRERILVVYGSLATPRFDFRHRVHERHPYRALESALARTFEVRDDADLDADNGTILILTGQTTRWSLYLSFLGPYATVTEIREDNTCRVVDAPTEAESEILFGSLRDHGVVVLPQDLLERPIELQLNYTEPENVRIFQALFGDYDVLPWYMRAG